MAKRQRLPTPAEFAPRLALYLDDLDRGVTLAAAYKAGAGQRAARAHLAELGDDPRTAKPDPLRPIVDGALYTRATGRPVYGFPPRRNLWPLLGWALLAAPWALVGAFLLWGLR